MATNLVIKKQLNSRDIEYMISERFLLLYERVNAAFPRGHLQGEVGDGQSQLQRQKRSEH